MRHKDFVYLLNDHKINYYFWMVFPIVYICIYHYNIHIIFIFGPSLFDPNGIICISAATTTFAILFYLNSWNCQDVDQIRNWIFFNLIYMDEFIQFYLSPSIFHLYWIIWPLYSWAFEFIVQVFKRKYMDCSAKSFTRECKTIRLFIVPSSELLALGA